jgi:hypothetical protein
MLNYNKENQFSILFPILKDYSIVRKFGIIIADNIFLNNVLYRIIEIYLNIEYKIKWKADH